MPRILRKELWYLVFLIMAEICFTSVETFENKFNGEIESYDNDGTNNEWRIKRDNSEYSEDQFDPHGPNNAQFNFFSWWKKNPGNKNMNFQAPSPTILPINNNFSAIQNMSGNPMNLTNPPRSNIDYKTTYLPTVANQKFTLHGLKNYASRSEIAPVPLSTTKTYLSGVSNNLFAAMGTSKAPGDRKHRVTEPLRFKDGGHETGVGKADKPGSSEQVDNKNGEISRNEGNATTPLASLNNTGTSTSSEEQKNSDMDNVDLTMKTEGYKTTCITITESPSVETAFRTLVNAPFCMSEASLGNVLLNDQASSSSTTLNGAPATAPNFTTANSSSDLTTSQSTGNPSSVVSITGAPRGGDATVIMTVVLNRTHEPIFSPIEGIKPIVNPMMNGMIIPIYQLSQSSMLPSSYEPHLQEVPYEVMNHFLNYEVTKLPSVTESLGIIRNMKPENSQQVEGIITNEIDKIAIITKKLEEYSAEKRLQADTLAPNDNDNFQLATECLQIFGKAEYKTLNSQLNQSFGLNTSNNLIPTGSIGLLDENKENNFVSTQLIGKTNNSNDPSTMITIHTDIADSQVNQKDLSSIEQNTADNIILNITGSVGLFGIIAAQNTGGSQKAIKSMANDIGVPPGDMSASSPITHNIDQLLMVTNNPLIDQYEALRSTPSVISGTSYIDQSNLAPLSLVYLDKQTDHNPTNRQQETTNIWNDNRPLNNSKKEFPADEQMELQSENNQKMEFLNKLNMPPMVATLSPSNINNKTEHKAYNQQLEDRLIVDYVLRSPMVVSNLGLADKDMSNSSEHSGGQVKISTDQYPLSNNDQLAGIPTVDSFGQLSMTSIYLGFDNKYSVQKSIQGGSLIKNKLNQTQLVTTNCGINKNEASVISDNSYKVMNNKQNSNILIINNTDQSAKVTPQIGIVSKHVESETGPNLQAISQLVNNVHPSLVNSSSVIIDQKKLPEFIKNQQSEAYNNVQPQTVSTIFGTDNKNVNDKTENTTQLNNLIQYNIFHDPVTTTRLDTKNPFEQQTINYQYYGSFKGNWENKGSYKNIGPPQIAANNIVISYSQFKDKSEIGEKITHQVISSTHSPLVTPILSDSTGYNNNGQLPMAPNDSGIFDKYLEGITDNRQQTNSLILTISQKTAIPVNSGDDSLLDFNTTKSQVDFMELIDHQADKMVENKSVLSTMVIYDKSINSQQTDVNDLENIHIKNYNNFQMQNDSGNGDNQRKDTFSSMNWLTENYNSRNHDLETTHVIENAVYSSQNVTNFFRPKNQTFQMTIPPQFMSIDQLNYFGKNSNSTNGSLESLYNKTKTSVNNVYNISTPPLNFTNKSGFNFSSYTVESENLIFNEAVRQTSLLSHSTLNHEGQGTAQLGKYTPYELPYDVSATSHATLMQSEITLYEIPVATINSSEIHYNERATSLRNFVPSNSSEAVHSKMEETLLNYKTVLPALSRPGVVQLPQKFSGTNLPFQSAIGVTNYSNKFNVLENGKITSIQNLFNNPKNLTNFQNSAACTCDNIRTGNENNLYNYHNQSSTLANGISVQMNHNLFMNSSHAQNENIYGNETSIAQNTNKFFTLPTFDREADKKFDHSSSHINVFTVERKLNEFSKNISLKPINVDNISKKHDNFLKVFIDYKLVDSSNTEPLGSITSALNLQSPDIRIADTKRPYFQNYIVKNDPTLYKIYESELISGLNPADEYGGVIADEKKIFYKYNDSFLAENSKEGQNLIEICKNVTCEGNNFLAPCCGSKAICPPGMCKGEDFSYLLPIPGYSTSSTLAPKNRSQDISDKLKEKTPQASSLRLPRDNPMGDFIKFQLMHGSSAPYCKDLINALREVNHQAQKINRELHPEGNYLVAPSPLVDKPIAPVSPLAPPQIRDPFKSQDKLQSTIPLSLIHSQLYQDRGEKEKLRMIRNFGSVQPEYFPGSNPFMAWLIMNNADEESSHIMDLQEGKHAKKYDGKINNEELKSLNGICRKELERAKLSGNIFKSNRFYNSLSNIGHAKKSLVQNRLSKGLNQ